MRRTAPPGLVLLDGGLAAGPVPKGDGKVAIGNRIGSAMRRSRGMEYREHGVSIPNDGSKCNHEFTKRSRRNGCCNGVSGWEASARAARIGPARIRAGPRRAAAAEAGRLVTSAGTPLCTMRPSSMTTSVWPRRTASPMSCVTCRNGTPLERCRSSSRAPRSSRAGRSALEDDGEIEPAVGDRGVHRGLRPSRPAASTQAAQVKVIDHPVISNIGPPIRLRRPNRTIR